MPRLGDDRANKAGQGLVQAALYMSHPCPLQGHPGALTRLGMESGDDSHPGRPPGPGKRLWDPVPQFPHLQMENKDSTITGPLSEERVCGT